MRSGADGLQTMCGWRVLVWTTYVRAQMTCRRHADNVQMTHGWCVDDVQMMCGWHADDVRMTPGVVLHEIGQLRQVFAWVSAINLTSNNWRSGKSGKYLPESGLLIWLVTTEGLVNQTRRSHLGQLCIKPTGLLVMNDFENCYCESNKGVAILGKMLNSKFYLIKFQMCKHFVFSVNNFENGYCENDKIHFFT